MTPIFHYTYILVSEANSARFYVGHTDNLRRADERTFKKIEILTPPFPVGKNFNEHKLRCFRRLRSFFARISPSPPPVDLLLPRLISGKLRVDDLDVQFPPGMAGMAKA